ncbi:DUF3330 domain-containing protein [Kaarinaea lacus]
MNDKPVPKEPDNVACQICLDEIPQSVAISHEADDYTQHFCGIKCYSLWKEKQNIEQTPQK